MKARFSDALLAAIAAATLAFLPAHAVAQQPKVFRMVAQSDLKILDPAATTNYVTRNFGHMTYDTLFARDANNVPQPQMIDKYTSSADLKKWTFTLRPNQKFHDGTPVTSADCIASIERWAVVDGYGRAMKTAGAAWQATGATTFTLTFQEPFGLVLEALSKPSSYAPVIMPERLAKIAPGASNTQVLGSGPYMFMREAWVPGSKIVFQKNPNYAGRTDPPSFLAGNKTGKFERIEWLILPDANSAAAALINNEVDMIEQVAPDYIAPLRADPNIVLGVAGTAQGALILNNLQPPFNNPKIRRALLYAVDQEKYMVAMGNPLNMRMKHCATFFICGGVNDTSAGSEPFMTPNIAKAKAALAEAGYKGEKVVVLLPTDYPSLASLALVAIQMLKDIGVNTDVQSMDWTSIVAKRTRKDPPASGGWSIYATQADSSSVDTPLSHFMIGSACGNSMPGWPCDPEMDKLRTAWLREATPAKRKALVDLMQERAFQEPEYLPLGQFNTAFAIRKEIKNIAGMRNGIPTLWMLDR